MRIALPIAGAAVVMLLLGGCVTHPPEVTSVPEPSATPVFATDEDALAAAEAAYAAYLAMSDTISADGGANPERIEPLVTAEWLTKEVSSFGAFAATGRKQTGATSFRDARLQQASDASVSIYVCTDSSSTRIVDGTGNDVTPASRETLTSLEVVFEVEEAGDLLLSSSDPWVGASFC